MIDKIINYVEHTPENTNPAVLATLLGDLNKQSDWNQNDDTQLDYVKNRPFYTGDPVETVLLEETTAKFTWDGTGLYSYELRNPLSLEVGQTYQVSWDGTIYECVCTDLEGRFVVLGNLSIVYEGADNTGEPFFYRPAPATKVAHFFMKTSGYHTISVTANIAQVTKIDKKYIPEYMDKSNPTGTGAFSLNRRVGSVVGEFSFAEGYDTIASGVRSHAEGWLTNASGNYSHAEGRSTQATKETSHAEGEQTKATAIASHAEGSNTKASGNYSHAEGERTNASGNYSHAEGSNTKASGYCSHAEGLNTTASGEKSHAEGWNTTASGNCSHAEGEGIKASTMHQHVQGKFNVEDSSGTYAHIVGNGTSDTARSNAHTLDWFGNAWYAGTVEGDAFILRSSTAGSTKKFKITVDDSGTISATEVK